MLRKIVGTLAKIPISNGSTARTFSTFAKSSDHSHSSVDGFPSIDYKTTFKDRETKIKIQEIHQVLEDPDSSSSRHEHTSITITDEKEATIARLTHNSCWHKTRVSLTTKESEKTAKFSGTTEEQCVGIESFFKGKNALAKTLFGPVIQGRHVEDILRKEGHHIVPSAKI